MYIFEFNTDFVSGIGIGSSITGLIAALIVLPLLRKLKGVTFYTALILFQTLKELSLMRMKAECVDVCLMENKRLRDLGDLYLKKVNDLILQLSSLRRRQERIRKQKNQLEKRLIGIRIGLCIKLCLVRLKGIYSNIQNKV